MEEEQEHDQCHDEGRLDQRALERADGRGDEGAPVVRGVDLHSRGKPGPDLIDPLLHPVDDILRVLSAPHHHDASDDFPLPVLFQGSAPDISPDLDACDLIQQNGVASGGCCQWDILNVLHRMDVPLPADEVLRVGHLDDLSSHIVVGTHDGGADIGEREAERLQEERVDVHLVLPDEPPHGGDLRHPLHALQVQPDIPVLHPPERSQIVLPLERVPEYVPDARPVGPELHLRPRGKA